MILRTQKIRKKRAGGVELRPAKSRSIDYAAHSDSHIFSHYAAYLGLKYEQELQERGLSACVTAFRSLNGRRNIHFADEVFEFISAKGCGAVLTTDISEFFSGLNHRLMKRALADLLKEPTLPEDHYRVFRAITASSHVDRTRLCEVLGLAPDRVRADGRHRFCSPEEFREKIRGGGLIVPNRSGKGIPQGSPISAVLANLYMLRFDVAVEAMTRSYGGLYRRYCDDIIAVLPTVKQRTEVLQEVRRQLEMLKLAIHPEKTEFIDFEQRGDRLTTRKPLTYLGFTFDGTHKRIRPASVAKFYRKMQAGVGRAKAIRYRVNKRANNVIWTSLRTRKLYIQYSYLGRHNFPAYAFQAAKIMNDAGIKKQVKAHWKRLQKLVSK